MWIFRRKRTTPQPWHTNPPCSHCGSTNTRLIRYHGTDQPNYVKIWRGQRALTYRCLDCGMDFYVAEPPKGITEEIMDDDNIVDDKEALRAAEEEIEKQIEEEDDRRVW